jgi:hypothetical protein
VGLFPNFAANNNTLKKHYIAALLLLVGIVAKAQINIPLTSTANNDTLIISGYVDGYFNFDPFNPHSSKRPYAVSSARLRQFAVNVAYLGIGYRSERVRLQLTPGYGTYMIDNYGNENVLNRFLLETYGGFKLCKNKNMWLDVGVFTSPYTYETPISKDHLLYSRSLAAENAPYYVSGLRLTMPLSPKFTLTLYGLNGWQTINFNSASARSVAFGSQLQYKIKPNLSLFWNTFAGDAGSPDQQWLAARYFNDFFLTWQKGKWDLNATAYIGAQGVYNSLKPEYVWYSVNAAARYKFNDKFSLSGRLEYFSDPNGVLSAPNQLQARPFETYSGTLGFNYSPVKNVLLRFEGRGYGGRNGIYTRSNLPVNYSSILFSSLAVWF